MKEFTVSLKITANPRSSLASDQELKDAIRKFFKFHEVSGVQINCIILDWNSNSIKISKSEGE